MLAVSALTARRRAPEVPGITWLTLAATSGSALLSLFVVFGLGVYPVVGRAIVPIAGMMIGNSIGSIVVASRRILGELADRRPEVEARLALGQPWQEASKPFVRSALRTALTSQIESTKAVGLVFLPGAMTGLILAGADPVDAVLVQAAIMYLILGLRRHQRRGHRARAHPPAVHARPPAGPPRPDERMTRFTEASTVTAGGEGVRPGACTRTLVTCPCAS